jgi:hypothetical protein
MGKKEGHGKLIYANDPLINYYEGEFYHNYKNGKGVIYYKSG